MNLVSDVKIILDSHVDEARINQIRQMHKVRMSGYDVVSNYSLLRGIVILIRKNSGFSATNINLLDLTDTIQFDLKSPDNTIYNMVCVYAPRSNDPKYWTELHRKVYTSKGDLQIIIGDFNTTLDPHLDKVNYMTDAHSKTRNVINSWIEDGQYVDAFRYLHPKKKAYSWRCDSKKTQLARLDLCLVTPILAAHLIKVDYTMTRSSDHSSLTVSIGTNIEKQGKGTFRAPPGIENEEAYQEEIKEGIQLSHIRCKKNSVLKKKLWNSSSVQKLI